MHPDDGRENQVADGGNEFRVERGADESTTQAVLRGIASIRGVSETEIEPVSESVDLEALEALVRHANERDNRVSLRFSVAECTVRVQENGTIRIVDESDGSTTDGAD